MYEIKSRAGRFLQIGRIEAKIHNLKEDLHTILFNKKVVEFKIYGIRVDNVNLRPPLFIYSKIATDNVKTLT